jgi:hypothetical protein
MDHFQLYSTRGELPQVLVDRLRTASRKQPDPAVQTAMATHLFQQHLPQLTTSFTRAATKDHIADLDCEMLQLLAPPLT